MQTLTEYNADFQFWQNIMQILTEYNADFQFWQNIMQISLSVPVPVVGKKLIYAVNSTGDFLTLLNST